MSHGSRAHRSSRSFAVNSILLAGLIAAAPLPATHAATITVNSTEDTTANDGYCTLREAITAANTNLASGGMANECVPGSPQPTVDTIVFNITTGLPGPVLRTIQASPLPTLSSSVTIDGYTQAGARANTLAEGNDAVLMVQVSGFGSNVTLLSSTGSGNAVRGLILNNSGILLSVAGANSAVEGNWIGTNAGGTDRGGGCQTGLLVTGANVGVGGTAPAARNVVAGCTTNMKLTGTNGRVEGNFIGTNAAGNAAFSTTVNANNGILAQGGSNNWIGRKAAGARNVIAAGGSYGILAAQTTGLRIQGDYFGIDTTGRFSLDGVGTAVYLEDVTSTFIGVEDIADPALDRNVIAGNLVGIELAGNASIDHTRISGNYIGTDAAASHPIPNGVGIHVVSPIETLEIWDNTISGNDGVGIEVASSSVGSITHVDIARNKIGSDASGALRNDGAGIEVVGVAGFPIDAPTIRQNFLSQNADYGIRIGYTGGAVLSGNMLDGNYCGGILLGGGTSGATVTDTISNNLNSPGCGAFGGHGILVTSLAPGLDGPLPAGNRFTGSLIGGNDGAGIFLATSPSPISTPNDAGDGDQGPNGLQNYPVITEAVTDVSGTHVVGSLNSSPNTGFDLEFFETPACDAHGFGEGAAQLGVHNVITDANGNASFDLMLRTSTAGAAVTATATNQQTNDTSEFSSCSVSAPPGGRFEFSPASASVRETDGSVTLTIVRSGASTGIAKVDYATIEGSAKNGTHFTATSGTLTFANAETSKTIVVSLVNNSSSDGAVSFTVRLRNASPGASIGMADSASVAITDDDVGSPPANHGPYGGGAVDPRLLAVLAVLTVWQRYRRARPTGA